ncbi:alpha/beta fold hydrolase [Nonomuraea sp. NPDC050328]|uniref:alpha/beta fold hydrolase n=1 Tax=Nonomuraea sp. NPDC050328 TaxID=3364361 RepID=UPI0037AF6AAF
MVVTGETALSPDGTPIAFTRMGKGPGLVLVHGGMEHAASHLQLAEALSGRFTVTLYDRRGRGTSGPYGGAYTMAKEVADLGALLAATETEQVFGVSSGALIALEAALALPAVRRVVAYEPPLLVEEPFEPAYMDRYERLLAAGDLAGAMVTGMRGAEMGPPLLNRLPGWLLRPMVRLAIRQEDRRAGAYAFTMRQAAPTLARDFQLVREVAGRVDRYGDVEADVLLLGGDRSPRYLKAALDALEAVLPRVRRVVFPGLGHGGSGNTDRGGAPRTVAATMTSFLHA